MNRLSAVDDICVSIQNDTCGTTQNDRVNLIKDEDVGKLSLVV